MARTLAQVQRQIDELRQLAEKLRTKEVDGVIKRIRTAIAHYQLTPDDLFGRKREVAATYKKQANGKKKVANKKPPSPVRYRDDKGNAWTGNGQRPRWFKEAIASGKTRDELAAKV
jgi:DNA-binding protein H-NS